MRRCILVFLSALPLLVPGCKKGESNLTQSTPSPTASASPTPVAQATPTPPPDTNRTAKFIVLLYHRFEDRRAELVTNPAKNHPQQLSIMRPVNLLNPETAADLKYEIISARTDMLIDPVTQGSRSRCKPELLAACAWQLKES